MNIYLDIDGVILTKNNQPSAGVVEFLEKVTINHNAFWLTTHCKGDARNAIDHLKRFLPEKIHAKLENIEVTDWDVLKTDAIDFSKDFLWFDDYVMESEKRVLEKNNCLPNLVIVNLREQPDFLQEYNRKL